MVQARLRMYDTIYFVLSVMLNRGTLQLLSQLDLKGAELDTKVAPTEAGMHAPEKLKATFKVSLEALGSVKVRVFYLHTPDHTVPYEDTLEAVNDLYQEGYL